MRLIKLSSNKDSFHTVKFNRQGISLITALKRTAHKKKTYNSVGKSLMISIIHFCLGANYTNDFESKLHDWEFRLEFEINEETFIVKRNTSSPKDMYLNEEKISLQEFKDTMAILVFNLTDDLKPLSFRNLISRFIRPTNKSYTDYSTFVPNEKPEIKLLCNAYLLGLNVKLILEKINLKVALDRVSQLNKNLRVDPILKNYFEGEDTEDLNSKLVQLKAKAKRLQFALDTYKVAEDYYETQNKANNIKKDLEAVKNEEFQFLNAIQNIEKSISLQPDISKDTLNSLFQEIKFTFPDNLQKSLKQIELFNSKLAVNRIDSLKKEKEKFELKYKDLNLRRRALSKDYDGKLIYLQSHRTLEEYNSLSTQLNDINNQINRFGDFKSLLTKYKNRGEEIKKELTEQNIITNNYLTESEKVINDNISLFQSLADSFYQDKPSGITFSNNSKRNRLRFNIDAKIQSDSGDAVNDVKIFCFDWTVLLGQHNHKIKYLVHDSRITDGMDTRQVAKIFSIAHEKCIENNLQYIVSANQNTLELLKSELSDEEYMIYINNNIVLELSDEEPQSKLLGIDIDLIYDKTQPIDETIKEE